MADNKDNNIRKSDDNDPFNFFKFDDQNNDKNNNKKRKKGGFNFGLFLLISVILYFVVSFFFSAKVDTNTIKYSEFIEKINNGMIVEVSIHDGTIIGYEKLVPVQTENEKGVKLFHVERDRKSYKTDILVIPNSLLQLLDEKGVKYEFKVESKNYFLSILFQTLFPIFLIGLLIFFMTRKMGGGAGGGMGSIFSVGNSRARVIEEGKIKTRFTDVAGVDEAKEELVEVVDFLKSPAKYTEIGGKIPKGVLLVGDPGTGKTLLARAVAGEAGVPFFSISGSDFVEMFVGVGASRVRDLFKQAREKAPCIVFIDEIDALGKNRANGFSSNDEREQTLNQLLVEMDGFENQKGLIILAATNRADILDPALLRPGRFDRQVPVEKPDVKGREEILRIHAKNVKLEKDVDFESVAHGTTGFAGADLANVVNEAALLAVRNNRKKVSMEDFNDAIDKVSIGLKKKSRKDNKKQMRLAAVHETGHALVGTFTPDYPPVNKITVVPRSHGVGGFTQYREEQEEKIIETKKDMINQIDTFLGGRAAEEIILGDISTGASNDIANATEIVKRMITVFGMSEKFKNMTLGKGVLGNRGGEPSLIREFSEDTQKYIDEEIARIMDERYQYVLKLLKKHKPLLEYVAERLMEVETMDGKTFYDIVNAEKKLKPVTETKALASKSVDAKQ